MSLSRHSDDRHYAVRVCRARAYFVAVPVLSVLLSLILYVPFSGTMPGQRAYLASAALCAVPMCILLAYVCLDVGKMANPLGMRYLAYGIAHGLVSLLIYGIMTTLAMYDLTGGGLYGTVGIFLTSVLFFVSVFMLAAVMESLYPMLGNITLAVMGTVQIAVVLFSDWSGWYLLPCAAMTTFSAYLGESGASATDPLLSFVCMGAVAAVSFAMYCRLQKGI